MTIENSSSEEFLTITEFSVLLRIHPQTVRRAIKNGRIHAFRVGIGIRAGFRIPRSEINRMAIVDLENIINELIEKKMNGRDPIPPQ
jgi:excisionase family DNA binding protein